MAKSIEVLLAEAFLEDVRAFVNDAAILQIRVYHHQDRWQLRAFKGRASAVIFDRPKGNLPRPQAAAADVVDWAIEQSHVPAIGRPTHVNATKQP